MATTKCEVISTRDFQIQICEALGLIPMTVRRIIIDIDAEKSYEPLPVYVQMVGDENLPSLDWDSGLEGAEIIRESKESKEE